jgi:hypothetical protein
VEVGWRWRWRCLCMGYTPYRQAHPLLMSATSAWQPGFFNPNTSYGHFPRAGGKAEVRGWGWGSLQSRAEGESRAQEPVKPAKVTCP